jgi:hypothetical protein
VKNTKTRADFGRRIKRGFLALAMAAGLTAGVTVATSTSASADTGGEYTVYHPIVPADACIDQGHFGAISFEWFNPYSLHCYDVSVPPSISIAGGVDIQAFCNKKFPGSTATVNGKTVWDWYCVRKEHGTW